jgi:hypothetical protein
MTMTDIRDLRVNTATLAELFDLSVQRIGQLARIGVLDRDADGLFGLQVSLANYERFIRSGPPHPARW